MFTHSETGDTILLWSWKTEPVFIAKKSYLFAKDIWKYLEQM
jgi:hypothetical protein